MKNAELHIVGRYTRSQMEISGSKSALNELGDMLKDPEHPIMIQLQKKDEDARPYEGFLRSVLVEDATGPVVVERQEDVMFVRGGRKFLGMLADSIGFVSPGEHSHEEYYDEHDYLGDDSIPLVVMCRA